MGLSCPFTNHNSLSRKNCTMHCDPASNNSPPQCHLLHLCSIVSTEVKPSPCQILTSAPVQSMVQPRQPAGTQWRIKPGGQRLEVVPSSQCPSPSAALVLPRPLPLCLVHIWWQEICNLGALSQRDTKEVSGK